MAGPIKKIAKKATLKQPTMKAAQKSWPKPKAKTKSGGPKKV